jgi:hypothetical protein
VRRSDPTQARPAASSGPTALPRPVAAAVGLAAVGSCAVRSVPGALIRLPFVGLRRAIIGAAAIMASYDALAELGDAVVAGRRSGLRPGALVGARMEDAAALPTGDARGAMRLPPHLSPHLSPHTAELVVASSYAGSERLAGEDATVTEHLRSGPSGEVGAAPLGVDESDAVSAADLPVPDYDRLSPAALRARLRRLDASQLALLRDHERTHADRLPVLTMLDSRIARLTAQAGGDAGG